MLSPTSTSRSVDLMPLNACQKTRQEESIVADPRPLKLFELEKQLKPTLEKIEQKRAWTLKKSALFAYQVLSKEILMRPMMTLSKITASLVGLCAIYPAVVGSYACVKTLQVVSLKDLESSDLNTAMVAAQQIGNMGMAVTYIYQLYEFVFHPISQLFIDAYNRRVCEEIQAIYGKEIEPNGMSFEKMQFLNQKKGQELAHYSYSSSPDSPPEGFEGRQEAIDRDLNIRLSFKNVFHLTALKVKNDIKTSSYLERLTKVIKTTFALGCFGACSFLLAAGTYGCYKPFSLQNPNELDSSDPIQVENAVANYANAGHGLEYIAVIGILGLKTIRSIIGKQIQEVIRQQTINAYKPHIEHAALSHKMSDFFYKQQQDALQKI